MRSACLLKTIGFAAILALATSASAAAPEAFIKSAWNDAEVIAGKSSDYDPEKAWSPFREVEVFGGIESGMEGNSSEVFRDADRRTSTYSIEGGFSFDVKSIREMMVSWKTDSRSQATFLREVRIAQALQRRYYLLIDYFQAKKNLKHLADHSDALERSFRAQSLSLRYGKSNPQGLLKAQVAVSTIQREMREATSAFESVKAQIKQIIPDFKESSFTIKNFITPEDIAAQRSLFKPGASTVTRRILETQVSQLKNEEEISLARQNAWIKGFKLSVEGKDIDRANTYDSPKYETIFKAAISFRLPFLGDDLIAIQSRPGKLAKAYEAQRELDVLSTQTKNTPALLKTMIDSYSQISNTLNSLARVERSIIDPQVALDTVLSVRAARSELLVLEKEILVAYIDLLFEQSVLIEQPDVNYLSASKVRL